MSDLKLIIGLGNPGKEYENTRHNVGFEVVDNLAASYGEKIKTKKFNSQITAFELSGTKLLIAKPQTFMNLSGDAVALIRGFYKMDLSDILVVTDDMALDPGVIRLRGKGSAGGHNGLKDIIKKLGSQEFARLRIGIGKSPYPDSRNYVLGKISGEEKKTVQESVERASACIRKWLRDGIDKAMTEFNV
ncbi:MAG: aminoacyl-tRNA hydrolase [Sedimentisphaeraceae bacterium JB056]